MLSASSSLPDTWTRAVTATAYRTVAAGAIHRGLDYREQAAGFAPQRGSIGITPASKTGVTIPGRAPFHAIERSDGTTQRDMTRRTGPENPPNDRNARI